MVVRIFQTALLAGAVAGVLLTAGQLLAVVPVILEAETYEAAGHAHGDAASVAGEAEAWAPEDGIERTAYTFLVNVLTAVGFGLLLTGCYALRGGVDWRRGILWGLGGFAVFQVAPALGLPPELPGAAAAELGARQWWWAMTVVLSAAGLAAVVFGPRSLKALGVVLLVVPHVVGAPQPEAHESLAPPELERAFIVASLATNAVFWVFLGLLTGLFYDRFGTGHRLVTQLPGAAR